MFVFKNIKEIDKKILNEMIKYALPICCENSECELCDIHDTQEMFCELLKFKEIKREKVNNEYEYSILLTIKLRCSECGWEDEHDCKFFTKFLDDKEIFEYLTKPAFEIKIFRG
ncbi:hypothetical protein M0R19_08280 [Candidatus Pacearchaeota archaeon]|nr:hypothetical protein [Candidatus Pacearchaeota archaeon]